MDVYVTNEDVSYNLRLTGIYTLLTENTIYNRFTPSHFPYISKDIIFASYLDNVCGCVRLQGGDSGKMTSPIEKPQRIRNIYGP